MPAGVLGICGDGEFEDYFIGIATSKPCPAGFNEIVIPESEWAIFECVGAMPHAIQELQESIYSEWLPTSGYDFSSAAPMIEVYPEGDNSLPDYKCQVWLPIQKSDVK